VADERIEALEAALLRIAAVSEGVAPPVVALAHRALADLVGIRTNRPLKTVSNQIARDFRLQPPDLQSKLQEQRIVFVRQLTMSICRKITGAPFKSIGEHFHRDHSTLFTATGSLSSAYGVMLGFGGSSRDWKAALPRRSRQTRRQCEVRHGEVPNLRQSP
jgi:chromosomal replication initiation ATPase DnaA